MAYRGSSWAQETWTTGLVLIFQEAQAIGSAAVRHRQGPRVMVKLWRMLLCFCTVNKEHLQTACVLAQWDTHHSIYGFP